MVAVVIMAETLLSENNFAFKNGYKIDDNREILACGVSNLAAAFVGCCPVNGSISRTSMNEQYGGKTQVVSITAGLSMILLLLFGTGFIGYLPVPVLTAIVISALMKVVEFDLAKRLYEVSKRILYFCGGFFRRAVTWNHLRSHYRNVTLFCGCDPSGNESSKSVFGSHSGQGGFL